MPTPLLLTTTMHTNLQHPGAHLTKEVSNNAPSCSGSVVGEGAPAQGHPRFAVVCWRRRAAFPALRLVRPGRQLGVERKGENIYPQGTRPDMYERFPQHCRGVCSCRSHLTFELPSKRRSPSSVLILDYLLDRLALESLNAATHLASPPRRPHSPARRNRADLFAMATQHQVRS